MNAIGYFFSRCGIFLGIKNNKKWLGNANRETHLLKEAETILGQLVWEEVDDNSDLLALRDEIKHIEDERKQNLVRLETLRKEPSTPVEDENIDLSKEPHHIRVNFLEVKEQSLEKSKYPHFQAIGHFYGLDKNLGLAQRSKTLKPHRDLWNKIRFLRKSVDYNLRLVHE